MFHPRLRFLAAGFFLLFLTLSRGTSHAAFDFKLVGSHPTSTLTTKPEIHGMIAYQNKLYLGHGDLSSYPAVCMVCYDPMDRMFHVEQSICSDSIDVMRVLGDSLWVPHADPIHYEDFQDLSWKQNGVWRAMAPFGSLHLYDCLLSSNGNYYAVGGLDGFKGFLARSTDQGRTWSIVNPQQGTYSRFNWCFELNGKVYCQTGSVDDATGVFSLSVAFANYEYLYHPIRVTPSVGASYIVALQYRVPGIALTGTSSLLTFDGTTIRTSVSGLRDFAVEQNTIYALKDSPLSVLRAINVPATATSSDFLNVFATGLPTDAKSLGAMNGELYAGATSGKLYATRGDGLSPASQGVVNELPAAQGRGLAFDGLSLTIGSPDKETGGVFLAGMVTTYEEPPADSQAWQSLQEFASPVPDYGGWFGKSISRSGDLLAVVETGADTSNAERGRYANVRVFRQTGVNWNQVTSISIPFAHLVQLSADLLVVGTANVAGNQAAGTPGVNVYRIVRDAQGVPSFLGQAQLQPSAGFNQWGYKPTTRVALLPGLVVAGFAGDPSRTGGTGMAAAWMEAVGAPGTYLPSQVWQQSPGTQDRFGYALAAEAPWLVVGAPRDDTTAPNAGAIYVYAAPAGQLPSTTPIKIVCPVAQADAEFGAAVAVRGTTLLVGAPGIHAGGAPQRGAVYVYRLVAGAWQLAGNLNVPASSVAGFGVQVAIGDVWMAAASRLSTPATTPIDSLTLQPRPDPVTGFDEWLEQYGLGGEAILPNADEDHNGLTLLMEYAFNLAPGGILSPPDLLRGPPGLEWRDGTQGFEYVLPTSDPRLTGTVEQSPDLESWTPPVLAPSLYQSGNAYSRWRLVEPIQVNQFYRLKLNYRR